MAQVEAYIAGRWTRVYTNVSLWFAALAQEALEYKHGMPARTVR
jgi:hypothetical protein